MNPYATPVIVVPRKSKLRTPLAETKRLVIYYWDLNKQIPKVQTTQTKSMGSLALIETGKIYHIWSRLKGAQYFTIPDIRSGYHHISVHPDSIPKTTFIFSYSKFQWWRVAFGVQTGLNVFLNLMFKLFFKYLDSFLAFWMDNLLIYSKTEEGHLKHLQLVLERDLKESNWKCSNMNFLKMR